MTTTNLLTYDNTGLITNCFVFETEDNSLAEQVKDNFSAAGYVFSNDINNIPGCIYFENVFYPPTPHKGWLFDYTEKIWKPPFEKPDSGFWHWDDEAQNWTEKYL